MDDTIKNALKKRTDKLMFMMYRDFPFWAFLIEKCRVRVVPKEHACSTACVNAKGDILINQEFYSSNSDRMMHFVLAHEVMHLLLGHFPRQLARDGMMWNISGDILINHMLNEHFKSKGFGLDLSRFCTADKFGITVPDECTAEMVYEELYKQSKDKDRTGMAGLPDGLGKGNDMWPGDGDESEGGPGFVVRERSETMPADAKGWEEAGLEAATRSQIAGDCPGFMSRLVDSMMQPKIAWHEHLAAYLRQKFCMRSGSRHTFTPPNRRYLYQDVIMTSRVGKKKPCLAFSVDTSGSMRPQDLDLAIGEMNSIRRQYKVPLYLIECDTQVHNAKWINPNEQVPELKGGGGTSFVPVMEHLQQEKPDVDVLVYFTDGYGDFGKDPGFDVIWVVNSQVTPPYGKVIRVDIDA